MMTTKERNNHLINKWDFMLQHLNDKKMNKIRYAKIFENTALYSDTNTLKLVLAAIQKMLYSNPELRVSTSYKQSKIVLSFEKDLVFDNNVFLPDGASAFINSISDGISKLFKEGELTKIHHLRLILHAETIDVVVYY